MSSKMKWAYRIAVFCGAFPLVCGTVVFLLWLITGWRWLWGAGVMTIAGGVTFFFIGVIALAIYYSLAFDSRALTPRRLRSSTLFSVALLLSNFPAAAGFTVAAIAIDTVYTVVVHNASRHSLDAVTVVGGGSDKDFGAIPPGESVRRTFWIHHTGELEILIDFGGSKHTATVDGYVCSDMGGYKEVTVNADDTITVVDTLRK